MTDATKKSGRRPTWWMWSLLAVVVLGGLLAAAWAVEYKKSVPAHELPAEAQSFLATYYPDESAVVVRKELDELRITYTVLFADGSQVSFRGNGEWFEVKSRQLPVPAELVPVSIREFVDRNFAGTTLRELKRTARLWEVELNNSVELKYDTKPAALADPAD